MVQPHGLGGKKINLVNSGTSANKVERHERIVRNENGNPRVGHSPLFCKEPACVDQISHYNPSCFDRFSAALQHENDISNTNRMRVAHMRSRDKHHQSNNRWCLSDSQVGHRFCRQYDASILQQPTTTRQDLESSATVVFFQLK